MILFRIVRLQHELKKTKNNVYQKASSVKSNVKGKSWEKPHGDAITDDQNKNGVCLWHHAFNNGLSEKGPTI
jgi:hypothetical protein